MHRAPCSAQASPPKSVACARFLGSQQRVVAEIDPARMALAEIALLGHSSSAFSLISLLASVLQAASHAKPKRAGSPGSRTPGRHLLKLTHRRWLITDPASQTIADGGQHHRLGHGRAERQMGRRGPDGRRTHFGVPTASPSDLVLKFMISLLVSLTY